VTRDVLVVDYGVGNLLSVRRALEACGGEVEMSGDPKRVAAASRLVVPGVGAFGNCVETLARYGLVEPIKTFAQSGRPFLGICVGMQMLLDHGEEFGRHEGLGLVPGHVAAIPATGSDGRPHRIPHIGWTRLSAPANGSSWKGTILQDLTGEEELYFVHSFTAMPEEPRHRLADCDYHGRRISAAIGRDQLFGCQFHPEKSGPAGLRILSRFLAL